MTIAEIRAALQQLAGGKPLTHLKPAAAHEAYKLMLQINPTLSDWRSIQVALGLTIVGLGPPIDDGSRVIEFCRSGEAMPLWPRGPKYYGRPDGTVIKVTPDWKAIFDDAIRRRKAGKIE